MKYNKIALVGLPGSGKTTIAKKTANNLSLDFIDCDSIFVEKYGNISGFFSEFGEDKFRLLEEEILFQISLNSNHVLSTGGGIILSEKNRKILFNDSYLTFYLYANPSSIVKRLKNDNTRPLLDCSNKLSELEKLLTLREMYYKLSNYTINTENKTIDEIVQEIVEKIK